MLDSVISSTTARGLNNLQISLLKKGNVQTVADLLLTPIQDVAKRCRSSPVEIKRIVDTVLNGIKPPELRCLDQYPIHPEVFTTGSQALDDCLGGGLRTGMVWEVVGESAAGKTQFALQSSLFVQLPQELGGLNGSTCYLTTSATLPTARLLQISQENNQLSNSSCGLEHIHTLATPTVSVLQHVLSDTLPNFIKGKLSKSGELPVKLLVIDALGELFHANDKTTTSSLVARSKDISTISFALHELATVYQLAILVLNEVIDIFDRPYNQKSEGQPGLLYENQSRWFNSAEFFGENKKEASLGLVWANQVNTRIMLSRTGRRKYLDLGEVTKRTRVTDSSELHKQAVQEDQQSTLIRRFSVIFSNICLPFCLDYIVTGSGIFVLPDQDSQVISPADVLINKASSSDTTFAEHGQRPSPRISNQKLANAPRMGEQLLPPNAVDGDDDENLWSNTDSYENLDWDALEASLSQAPMTGNNDDTAAETVPNNSDLG